MPSAECQSGIIGPYFFDEEEGRTVTVNTERYTAKLEIFLINELNLLHLNSVWFQQDIANAHKTEMEYIYIC
jgi:hypothetical protein